MPTNAASTSRAGRVTVHASIAASSSRAPAARARTSGNRVRSSGCSISVHSRSNCPSLVHVTATHPSAQRYALMGAPRAIGIAGTDRDPGRGVVVDGLVEHQRGQHVEHGDVDELADTREIALTDRGDDSQRSKGRSRVVGDGDARPERRPVRKPGLRHRARRRLDDHVHRRSFFVGLSVAGDRAGDEARPCGPQRIVPEAEARHGAGPGVLDEHVGVSHETPDELLALGLGDVERNRTLPARPLEERHRQRTVDVVGRAHRRPGRPAAACAGWPKAPAARSRSPRHPSTRGRTCRAGPRRTG